MTIARATTDIHVTICVSPVGATGKPEQQCACIVGMPFCRAWDYLFPGFLGTDIILLPEGAALLPLPVVG